MQDRGHMVDDGQLVREAQHGDRRALAALYSAYRAPVYRYITYRVGDPALAEDLTADVFVSMVRHIGSYDSRGRPFLAWLYVVAGNTCKMHYRRQQLANFEPLPETMTADMSGPEEIAQLRLTQARLLNAMPRLTEDQRQVILLKFIEGFSNAEVAAILDKSEGAIRVLQHRALAALRQALAEEERHEPV
jgi:RNA polymerase sigma-70 factor (ECF subfamily)